MWGQFAARGSADEHLRLAKGVGHYPTEDPDTMAHTPDEWLRGFGSA